VSVDLDALDALRNEAKDVEDHGGCNIRNLMDDECPACRAYWSARTAVPELVAGVRELRAANDLLDQAAITANRLMEAAHSDRRVAEAERDRLRAALAEVADVVARDPSWEHAALHAVSVARAALGTERGR
jgi:hypothetical protein